MEPVHKSLVHLLLIYIYISYICINCMGSSPPPSVFCPDITCMFDSALSTATTHSKAAPVRKTAKALKLHETEESSKIHSKWLQKLYLCLSHAMLQNLKRKTTDSLYSKKFKTKKQLWNAWIWDAFKCTDQIKTLPWPTILEIQYGATLKNTLKKKKSNKNSSQELPKFLYRPQTKKQKKRGKMGSIKSRDL